MECLLEEVAEWARQEIPPQQFYQQLLGHAIRLLAIDSATAWDTAAGSSPECLTAIGNLPANPSARALAAAAVLEKAEAALECRFVFADTIYGTVRVAAETVRLLEFPLESPHSQTPAGAGTSDSLSSSDTANLLAGRQQIVDSLVAHAENYEYRQRLRTTAARLEQVVAWRTLLLRRQRNSALGPTAYSIANDGRLLAGCDHVSVLVQRRRWRTVAASGVDVVDARSRKIKLLESLVESAAAIGEPLWFPGDDADRPPQTQLPLDAYLDAAHAQRLAVLPIRGATSADKAAAAIVVEDRTSERSDAEFREAASNLHEWCAGELRQAIILDRIPLRWLMASASRHSGGRSWLRRGILAAVVLILLSVAATLPVPLRISAAGSLQPQRRQHLFAPEDATVAAILVKHGQAVEVGEPLLALAAPELDLQLTAHLGELQVVQQQLQSARAQRLAVLRADQAESRFSAEQLASEEQRHAKRAEFLRQQISLLEARRDSLRVRSPLDGLVLTWETEQLLSARPVHRGQRLLTVAAPAGPWELELLVSDRDIQQVLSAQLAAGEALPVWFSLGTHPEQSYRGTVGEVAERSEARGGQPPTVHVRVHIDESRVRPLRAGSEVVARIECGRRPMIYVWCRGLWDAIRLKFFV